MIYRFGKQDTPRRRVEKYCFRKERQNTFCYLWAGLSLDVFERFHAEGVKIIIERINCHQAMTKDVLSKASAALHLPPDHNITPASLADERRKLEISDAIFCPSPMVSKSLIANGVDQNKLLQTSYGWSPNRFPNISQARQKKTRQPIFLFVGALCVRKGVPLLLKAWEQADIAGQLIFCGNMDKAIQENFSHYFKREDICYVPHTDNIGHYYNLADVFVFPSLEEGGPMVTYEAMAHGVIPLVSKMGAGAIVQDKKNGLILEYNVESWRTAILAVSQRFTRMSKLAVAARERAAEFTWDKVAARRATLLQAKFPELWR